MQARTYFEEVRRLQRLLDLNGEARAKELETQRLAHQDEMSAVRREQEVSIALHCTALHSKG